jgi:hypothetical protein
MDLTLHLRVLWRFRLVVAVGLLAAIALALFSYVRVGFGGRHGITVAYRQHQQYVAYTQILVTQTGFPEGRSVVIPPTDAAPASPSQQQFADPSRFTSLALLYAKLIDTDPVWRIARRDGPLGGKIEAAALPATDNGNGDALPVLSVASIANSKRAAIELGRRLTDAFVVYIDREQADNGIRPRNRVKLDVVKAPEGAKVFAARSKALPIVVFASMLFATFALAFVLENMRPRVRMVEAVRHGSAERNNAA